jgi:hypothetical protein
LKKLALLLSLISISTFAEENYPKKQYSIGLGMGAPYSGLGANFSLLSKTDMKYVSLGCTEYSSRYGSSCGFGAGWIVTDLFDYDSNNHGLGVYVSKVGEERYATLVDGKFRYYEDDYYGVGISYTYFMNGIDKSGTTFGVSIHATNADYDARYGGLFQVGYQF